MTHLFAAIGGCGSTYLIRKLRERYRVDDKPDTVYRPLMGETRIGSVNASQGTLADRAPGFPAIAGESLENMFQRYVVFVRNDPLRTGVLNTVSEFALFSRCGIRDVVFLVRHPLHAYASWAKPERHGNVVEYLGGIQNVLPAKTYFERWRRFSDEALAVCNANLGGRIIRFEYARADASGDAELMWLFEEFDSSRRNWGVVSDAVVKGVRAIVAPTYRLLYDSWDV
jgi:hypothetical protein